MALSKESEKYPPGVVVSAAIDLGTAFSGYAFAFRDKPFRIFASTWHSRTTANFVANKAPTTVLLRQNGEFDSFGLDAEEKYSELTDEENHHGWYYFQNFKMELYRHEKLSRKTKLKDIEGKEMPAMTIFTMVIKYLREKLVEQTRRSKTDIEEHEILWVLTVPAIWSDAAKQFMREAAKKAGILNTQLKLVLEPEAASLFGQANVTQRDVQAGEIAELKHFQAGQKYIIADLGGGTADIATHEVLRDGTLREICRATGDELGGNRVNLAFQRFLDNCFGEKVMQHFRLTARGDYLEFLREFEMKKRLVSADGHSSMLLKCPASFGECLFQKRQLTIQQCIEVEKLTKVIEVKKDKIKLLPELVKVFFNEPVEEIIKKIRDIIQGEKFDINKLILVGGFSDSPFVRETVIRELKRDFQNLDIVKPEEASLHVLKGAVLTALRPNHISERISRYSYGFRAAVPFDVSVHPAKLLDRRRSGEEFCSEIFHKCIELGQCLKYGEKLQVEFIGNRRDPRRKNEACSTELYRSTHKNPKYCTPEEGCKRVGKMIHKPPEGGWGNIVMFTAEVEIGEAELKITVINGTTQEVFETIVDFLDD